MVLLDFILFERSYDNHIKNKENIYRALQFQSSDSRLNGITPFLSRSLIINNIPEVKDVVRCSSLRDVFIKKGENYIPEKRFCCGDFEIFKNFDIPLLSGNFSQADYDHYIAMSRKTALKYFPDGNAVGNMLTLNQAGKELSVMVTAVFENIPDNSTFYADIIGNFQIKLDFIRQGLNEEFFENPKNYSAFNSYITLNQKSNPKIVEEKLSRIIFPPEKNSGLAIRLQPLKDIYLGSEEIENSFLPDGSSLNIKLFTIICIIIIIIACSNFAIISAVNHYHRNHEYFIRVSHGATRFNILAHILGEIFLIMLISMIFSIVLSTYLKPFVGDIFEKQINLDQRSYLKLIGYMAAILAFILLSTVGLISFLISGGNPGTHLQKDMPVFFPFIKWNKLLILFQIAIFCVLIVISSILLNQWKFLKSKDALGFNPEKLLVLELPEELQGNCDVLMHELSLNSQIVSLSETCSIPLIGPVCQLIIFKNEDYSNPIYIEGLFVGLDYFKTTGLSIVEGRSFDASVKYDQENSIMINEAAVKLLQLNEPIGKKVDFREVVGVVKDFPYKSLYEKISPMIILPLSDLRTSLLIRYQGDRASISDYIAKKQSELVPVSTLKLDEFNKAIDETYIHEKKLKSIFVLFTIIAVILGIFGIIGLLIFTLQKRSKEITIRIIHGASFFNIVSLISREFIITVIISNIVTYPFIWYFANDWLNNFTNHIKINVLYFLLGTGSTIFLALMIISLIVFKHIRENPVKNFNR
jgi:putative ABC transport system permease protein